LKDLAAELNGRGEKKWHAMHYAANNGHLKIIEFLLNQPKIEI
jgi:hypothetical protein